MEKNYTPVDVEKLAHKSGGPTHTALLLFLTVATGILAVLLFFLIQKKVNTPPASVPTVQPTVIPSATPEPTVTILPPSPVSTESSQVSSPSATPLNVTPTVIPTVESTPSATVTSAPQ